MIVGETPLKSMQDQIQKRFCGEKAYASHFKLYKPVCHFIAAFEFLRQETEAKENSVSLDSQIQIERFLQIANFFREQLLLLITTNIKNTSLFLEESLIPLPPWVNSLDVAIPIAPFSDTNYEIEKAS